MKQISELLKKLHEDADVTSYFLLGYLYEKGELVPQDFRKSFAYYSKAASIDVSLDDDLAMKYKVAAWFNALILNHSGHGRLNAGQNALALVELAHQFGGADILYRLGVMYEKGILIPQNQRKYWDYYFRAENQNNAEAKRWVSILSFKRLIENSAKEWLYWWPKEDWLTKEECGSVGLFFGSESGSSMSKLHSVISIYERHTKNKQDFSLARDCSDSTQINYFILAWLQNVSHNGVAEGSYVVGKYALERLNEISSSINLLFLSSWFLKLPFYAESSQNVESYVKLYAWAQAWLHRAKSAGKIEAENELRALAKHKDKVEVTCNSIYTKYKLKVAKDDQLWTKTLALISADQQYRSQWQNILTTVPNQNIHAQISKLIAEDNVREYEIWKLLITDESELNELHNDHSRLEAKSLPAMKSPPELRQARTQRVSLTRATTTMKQPPRSYISYGRVPPETPKAVPEVRTASPSSKLPLPIEKKAIPTVKLPPTLRSWQTTPTERKAADLRADTVVKSIIRDEHGHAHELSEMLFFQYGTQGTTSSNASSTQHSEKKPASANARQSFS